MNQSKYLNSSGLTFKVNQMDTKESIKLPNINHKSNKKVNQDYAYNETKQENSQFLYGQSNQNYYSTFDNKKQLKLPLKILQSIEKQNDHQNKSLSVFMKKQSNHKIFQNQSDMLVSGIIQNYSNEISGSDIYDFTQKFISSGKETKILNEAESKVKEPSIKRQLNRKQEHDENKNKVLPYSYNVSAQKNDLTTSDTELKSRATGNFSSLEDTIQMSKSDISKRQIFSKIQSKIGNSKLKALNELGKKEISPYQNLSIVENHIDEQNYFTDKSYEQEQIQNKTKMISNFGTNLLQYNKINSSDYNPLEQKQILIKSQKLNILIKKKEKRKEDEYDKPQRMNSLNQSQVIKKSDLNESNNQESRKNKILNQIELFKQNIKKNSISQMSKEEIIVQSQIIRAQQSKAKAAVKKNPKNIIKEARNQYSNHSFNLKQPKQQKLDNQKSNLQVQKSGDDKKDQINEIKQKRNFSQKSFLKDANQDIVKCDHCKKPKIKNKNQLNSKHQFYQSPIKYIKESKARSISENHKQNVSDQNSNLQLKNKSLADKLLLKSQDKRLSIESGTSPNLIRFLERNNSKDRLLLTKAYNISLQNQIEFQQKNSPQNRFFRLYVQDQQESIDGDSLSEQNKNLKKLKMKQKQHPLSPKTSRRMINALQPCYRQANDNSITRQEKQKKKIEDQIEKNTAEENFHLFVINEGARQIILQRQDVCNCSQMHRNRMIDKSMSIHSVNSVRTAILNRMRRRNKKQGYSEINESAGEQQTDEGADEINRRMRLGQNQKQNPHRPCRRTCSTVHNPMFHPWKQGRVQSADQLRKKKRMELLKIDWQKTLMYKHIDTANFKKYIDIRQEETNLIKNKKTIDNDNDGMYKDELMKRKINLKNQKLTSIFQNRDQQVSKQLDKLDMKHLHSQIDQELVNEQKKQKVKLYSSKETEYFYSLVKQEDMIDRDEDFIKSLILKSQNTLQMLMNSLMLNNEYEIIQASYQSKLNFKNNKVIDKKAQRLIQLEIIKKILLRCRNFFEAKYEIVRILVKTTKRDNLINQFEQELQDGNLEAFKAKNYYQIILKLSCRIFNQIEKIRVDNPMLNRPFIYQQTNLQAHMIKQILNIRTNLKNKFESLFPKTELDQILDKTGKIIKISELSQINRELESHDPFGSSTYELQSIKGFNRKKSKNEQKQSPNKREYDLDQRKIFIGLMRQNDGKMQSQRVQLAKQQENIVSNLFNNSYEVNSANSCKVNKNILK